MKLRDLRSMAFTASCTAMCTMAYMRASARPLPLMCIHAAVAAFAAFSFHSVTASAEAALGHRTRSDRHRPMLRAIWFFIRASSISVHYLREAPAKS